MNAILKSLIAQIREINRKYEKPEMEMTWLVKFCLISLRLYLLLLVVLMIVKFVIAARH
jgi:hypothetical protein